MNSQAFHNPVWTLQMIAPSTVLVLPISMTFPWPFRIPLKEARGVGDLSLDSIPTSGLWNALLLILILLVRNSLPPSSWLEVCAGLIISHLPFLYRFVVLHRNVICNKFSIYIITSVWGTWRNSHVFTVPNWPQDFYFLHRDNRRCW